MYTPRRTHSSFPRVYSQITPHLDGPEIPQKVSNIVMDTKELVSIPAGLELIFRLFISWNTVLWGVRSQRSGLLTGFSQLSPAP